MADMAGLRFRARDGRASITLAVVAAGLVPLLLCAALVLYQSRSSVVAHDRQNADQTAQALAGEVDHLFAEWRTEILIAANNEVLTRWYTEPDRRDELRPAVERLLIQLHSLYPDLIDEACFID